MSPGAQTPADGQRRLAAIVFTDVVGYSALTQKDEAGTLRRVKADLARLRELCAEHGGEVLNSMGDGLLLCFPSVVEAVACALKAQSEFNARSAEALRHRMGVHLGDVFREEGHVAGDGVNIAARLQTKARPGTVCLSQSVFVAVDGKLSMRTEALGPQEFKNIGQPIICFLATPTDTPAPFAAGMNRRRAKWPLLAVLVASALALGIYFLRPAPRPAPVSAPDESRARPADDKSVAVLPFVNMSDDKDNTFVADGIHEEILTDLANIASLRIISRTSVMQYRGTLKSISQIAKELGVAYILEGSVRKDGKKVRVTGQLIRAATDTHLWAKSYDGDLTDILSLQAQVATAIATQLESVLTPEESSRINSINLADSDAYEIYLKARDLRRGSFPSPEVDSEALKLLQRSTELDPKFALSWVELAGVHIDNYFQDNKQTGERELAKQALDKALALAPNRAEVLTGLGEYFYFGFFDYDQAATYYRRALELQPSGAYVHNLLSVLARRQFHWREALLNGKQAHELDPLNEKFSVIYRSTLNWVRDYASAAEVARVLAEQDPQDYENRVQCAWLNANATLSRKPLDEFLAGRSQAERETMSAKNYELWFEFMSGDAARFMAAVNSTRILESKALDDDVALEIGEARRILGTDQGAILTTYRDKLEGLIANDPNDRFLWLRLATVCAVQGDRARLTAALAKVDGFIDPVGNPLDAYNLEAGKAQALAWSGDKAGAIEILQRLLKIPGPALDSFEIKYGLIWWPLRGDPRFDALVADPATYHPPY